jgi:hypothetical protein
MIAKMVYTIAAKLEVFYGESPNFLVNSVFHERLVGEVGQKT